MTDAYDALNDNAVETAERFNAICGDNVREAAAGAEIDDFTVPKG